MGNLHSEKEHEKQLRLFTKLFYMQSHKVKHPHHWHHAHLVINTADTFLEKEKKKIGGGPDEYSKRNPWSHCSPSPLRLFTKTFRCKTIKFNTYITDKITLIWFLILLLWSKIAGEPDEYSKRNRKPYFPPPLHQMCEFSKYSLHLMTIISYKYYKSNTIPQGFNISYWGSPYHYSRWLPAGTNNPAC